MSRTRYRAGADVARSRFGGCFAERKKANCPREAQLPPNVARLAPIAFICGVASFGGEPRTAWAQTALSVEVLSSRPELVTGGDALIRIMAPEAPQVTIGARDVSAAFRRDQKGGWIGLVEGVQDGGDQPIPKARGKR